MVRPSCYHAEPLHKRPCMAQLQVLSQPIRIVGHTFGRQASSTSYMPLNHRHGLVVAARNRTSPSNLPSHAYRITFQAAIHPADCAGHNPVTGCAGSLSNVAPAGLPSRLIYKLACDAPEAHSPANATLLAPPLPPPLHAVRSRRCHLPA